MRRFWIAGLIIFTTAIVIAFQNFSPRETSDEVGGVLNWLSPPRSMALGEYHSCALKSGAVKCWGDNFYGQVGDPGDASHCRWNPSVGRYIECFRPVSIPSLSSGVIGIASGYTHSCALMSDKTVRCWGRNYEGQLGIGTGTPSGCINDGIGVICLAPIPIAGLTGVKKIAAGGFHTCAILTNGGLKCWGADFSGQLGIGSQIPSGCIPNQGFPFCTIPITVPGLANLTSLGLGQDHSCAINSSGALYCWGGGGRGQLGIGLGIPTGCTDLDTDQIADICQIPILVTGVAGLKQVSGGGYHTCALTIAGNAFCWGYNEDPQNPYLWGQLGLGTSVPSVCQSNMGHTHLCHTPVPISGANGAKRLAAGGTHTCARMGNGQVKCWGSHVSGMLGVGEFPPSGSDCQKNGAIFYCPSPTTVGYFSSATNIAAGGWHTCSFYTYGRGSCWGSNFKGQIGYGSSVPYTCKTWGSAIVCYSPTDVYGL